MFQKRIKVLKYENFGIEKDEKLKENYGIAYISSTDQTTLTLLVKLHFITHFDKNLFEFYKLRTYLMGFAYDSMEEDVYEHTPFQK